MPTHLTLRNGRRIALDTPEEDARITKAAVSDPDARPYTDAEWEAAKPLLRRGRPKAAKRRVCVSLRLLPEVVNAFRVSGPGWQTRMNAALVDWLKTHSPADLPG
jgi:uncharacterized protein (DUF4415 family)